jgi:hypothetical protein
MMEAARTSETSVDNHFTRQYNPEDSSEHHTRRRENLKSHLKIRLNLNLRYTEEAKYLFKETDDKREKCLKFSRKGSGKARTAVYYKPK